jgi:hypothetical protein
VNRLPAVQHRRRQRAPSAAHLASCCVTDDGVGWSHDHRCRQTLNLRSRDGTHHGRCQYGTGGQFILGGAKFSYEVIL